YYAMDRDKRWDRVAKAYHAIMDAEGPHFANAGAVIADAYAHEISDEFVVPAVVGDYRGMRDGGGVLCFNFRADRGRRVLPPPRAGRHDLPRPLHARLRGLAAPPPGPPPPGGRNPPKQRRVGGFPGDDLPAADSSECSRPGHRRRGP